MSWPQTHQQNQIKDQSWSHMTCVCPCQRKHCLAVRINSQSVTVDTGQVAGADWCVSSPGSQPDSKTWRFFYFGDLWPEGLLASLTYINGPSSDLQIWKFLRWKSDKYFKMNIRTIQLNGPIQCKILFYTSVPDFVIISTTFMWYLRKNSSIGWTLYSLSRWCTKIWFCNLTFPPIQAVATKQISDYIMSNILMDNLI